MTCPACGAASATERCTTCGALIAPASEGALAPDPHHRPRGPAREIPGMRGKKNEPTWKDEVRERIKHRKQRQAEESELPLFKEPAPLADVTPPARIVQTPRPAVASEPTAPSAQPSVTERSEAPAPESADARLYAVTERVMGVDRDAPARGDEPLDLPLHAPVPATPAPGLEIEDGVDLEAVAARGESDEPGEWSFDLPVAPIAQPPARAVERPARATERTLAALLDGALLLGIWSAVAYFASRAAHVGVQALLPTWPYLLGYFAFLGLGYAAFFTGTTGQTIGKLAAGLRVVDGDGRPPGYLRALARAAAGSTGVLLGFAGVAPMFFDPARRTLHDRLLKTRVIKG